MLQRLLHSYGCAIFASTSSQTRQLGLMTILFVAVAGVCVYLCRAAGRFVRRALLRRNVRRLPSFTLVVTHHQVHRSDILPPTLVLLQARFPDTLNVLTASDLQRPCKAAQRADSLHSGDGNRLFVTLGPFDESLIVWCMDLLQCRYVLSINELAAPASAFHKQRLRYFRECPTTDPSIRRYERV
jgi:hypothetical protein